VTVFVVICVDELENVTNMEAEDDMVVELRAITTGAIATALAPTGQPACKSVSKKYEPSESSQKVPLRKLTVPPSTLHP